MSAVDPMGVRSYFFRLTQNSRRWFATLGGMFLALSFSCAVAGEADDLGLRVSPASPMAGQVFTIEFGAMACQVFFSENSQDRVVEVSGTTVRVTVEHVESQVCTPEPVLTWSWSVGPLPEGAYTLVLVGEEPFDGGSTTELAQVPLTIVAPAVVGARVVPATQGWALALLALALSGAGAVAVRGRGN